MNLDFLFPPQLTPYQKGSLASLVEYKREHNPIVLDESLYYTLEPAKEGSLPSWWLKKRPVVSSVGYVTQRKAGDYIERRVSCRGESHCSIIKLPHEVLPFDDEVLKPYVRIKDCYEEEENGEVYLTWKPESVRFMKESRTAIHNMKRVRKACDSFKWLVRANSKKIKLFVTLTYGKNMKDTKQLYEDFRRYWQKLAYRFPAISGYLVAFEPQKRGAWHAHVLLLADKPLYIPNKVMWRIWGHGFTKVQHPRGIRDIGAYLTAYLTNIKSGSVTKKGARLYLYPAGFHFLRHSKTGVSYCDTTKWYGEFDSIPDLEHCELIYDHFNISHKTGMVTRVFAFMHNPDYVWS